jgi:hypothetical protein
LFRESPFPSHQRLFHGIGTSMANCVQNFLVNTQFGSYKWISGPGVDSVCQFAARIPNMECRVVPTWHSFEKERLVIRKLRDSASIAGAKIPESGFTRKC